MMTSMTKRELTNNLFDVFLHSVDTRGHMHSGAWESDEGNFLHRTSKLFATYFNVDPTIAIAELDT